MAPSTVLERRAKPKPTKGPHAPSTVSPVRLTLSLAEARGLLLAAQGLLHAPTTTPSLEDVRQTIERLGVLQIDTINVVERTQYLVLWSRLGAYKGDLLDQLLYPERTVFEYWGHAASIVPMRDYPYYRGKMLRYSEHMWSNDHAWAQANPTILSDTLDAVRQRGPLASADFERTPGRPRTGPWDWHGPKESRHALEILWTIGDLMIHSRRGGQKVYDLRERVLAEVPWLQVPDDTAVPDVDERRRHFARRTIDALGVIVPSWLWDYFRLAPPAGPKLTRRGTAQALLEELQREGFLLPASIEGLDEPAFITPAMLPVLERLRGGETPTHTTLLSPFDSLIWDRARARALFDYEVCFEAYVPPPKRRFGYYCLAILHRGRLVGRLDPKMERAARRLTVRSLYLEPNVVVEPGLLDGLATSLRDLAHFLGADTVAIGEGGDAFLAAALREHLLG